MYGMKSWFEVIEPPTHGSVLILCVYLSDCLYLYEIIVHIFTSLIYGIEVMESKRKEEPRQFSPLACQTIYLLSKSVLVITNLI